MSYAKNTAFVFIVGSCLLLLQSCSVSKQIHKQAHEILLQDSVIHTGHIGISIYEPATNRYLYNYNADKYFVPASNVKLFTLYAAMKYLGDSLVGLRYREQNGTTIIYPNADPTFLHPSFPVQSIFGFLKSKKQIDFCTQYYTENLGKGWAWDDYNEPYMTERNEFPMYGNLLRMDKQKDSVRGVPKIIKPSIDPLSKQYYSDTADIGLYRIPERNEFSLTLLSRKVNHNKTLVAPMVMGFNEVIDFLSDTLKKEVQLISNLISDGIDNNDKKLKVIHSQPTDSLLTPMMHNSDNFFGEQTLLMASNEHLGYMNDEAIIDTLLKTDLKDVPQQPKWVDGSGLSRYNLFTAQSFVYILNKMEKEFGLQRLKTILPTGGEGTLKNYYNSDSGFIYAKTGSLSNQITLSGYLITKKNKLLAFSLLSNNVMGDGWKVRRAYEQFLKKIREQY